jgi:hypothetical protein
MLAVSEVAVFSPICFRMSLRKLLILPLQPSHGQSEAIGHIVSQTAYSQSTFSLPIAALVTKNCSENAAISWEVFWPAI